ncbi:MAG TPA: tRNA (adenosine(37)-N6)-threonylcarbamoyltransferase complex dimerization subunit type 1 TsaB [Vulgatibacter sp.]|nr:tRNA (adenosine(37)-N6)-threonylcarbamoyltransferase complex dimerization subunit type 1 TsaB [Vulgatibacter sp.]
MKARTLLGLDTSTLSISVAVVREVEGRWRVLARRDRGPTGPNHSTLLPGWIDEVLQEAGVRLQELDGIGVGIGPGSFTGLRISLATAKGLAYAARLPLAGVSTLQAMALQARGLVPHAGAFVPLLDARKREVYAGFYLPQGDGVVGAPGRAADVVAPPPVVAAALADLPGPLVLLGEGYLAYRALLDEATFGRRAPQAEGLCETPPAPEVAILAAGVLPPFSKEAVFSLEPRYLRPWEAEHALAVTRR